MWLFYHYFLSSFSHKQQLWSAKQTFSKMTHLQSCQSPRPPPISSGGGLILNKRLLYTRSLTVFTSIIVSLQMCYYRFINDAVSLLSFQPFTLSIPGLSGHQQSLDTRTDVSSKIWFCICMLSLLANRPLAFCFVIETEVCESGDTFVICELHLLFISFLLHVSVLWWKVPVTRP